MSRGLGAPGRARGRAPAETAAPDANMFRSSIRSEYLEAKAPTSATSKIVAAAVTARNERSAAENVFARVKASPKRTRKAHAGM